ILGAVMNGAQAVAAGDTLDAADMSGLDYVTASQANGLAGAFSYTASDGDPNSPASQTVTITVTAVNDPPVNTAAPSVVDTTHHFGATLSVNIGGWNDDLDDDADLDNNYTPNLIVTRQWQRRGGGARTDPIEDIAGATDPTYILTVEDNLAEVRCLVTCTDDGEGTPGPQSTSVATEWQAVVNEVPEITEGGAILLDLSANAAGVPEAFALTLNASDPDGDTLDWSVSVAAVDGVAGTSTARGSTSVTYTPPTEWDGLDTFTVQVSDGLEGIDETVVTVRCPWLMAVADASVREAGEQATDLTPIVQATREYDLEWQNGYVRLGIWMAQDDADQLSAGSLGVAGENGVWLFIPSELRARLGAQGNVLRTAQLLGMSEDGGNANRVFVDLWVRAQDLFRPARDAEIDDASTELAWPANPIVPAMFADLAAYQAWFAEQEAPQSDLPFTGFGYTYDWNADTPARGVAEYVLCAGTEYRVASMRTLDGYLAQENGAPTVVGAAVATDEDVPTTVTLSGTDPEGDALTYTIVSQPEHGMLGTVLGTTVVYTPDADWNGVDSFLYGASDGESAGAGAVVTVTVSPVNDAPTFESEPVTEAEEDDEYSYVVSVIDVDSGDVPTISAPTLPSWLVLGPAAPRGGAVAILSGTPGNEHVGLHAVVLRATDGDDVWTEQQFIITVMNTNDAPVLGDVALDPPDARADESWSYAVPAGVVVDPDVGDVLLLTVVTKPGWMDFDDDHTLSGTPALSDVGDHDVTLEYTDQSGESVIVDMTVTVGSPVPLFDTARITAGDPNWESLRVITSGWSDPDGDLPGYLYEWTVNDEIVVGADSEFLDNSYFEPGDSVSCSVTAWDGVYEGNTIETDAAVVVVLLPGWNALSLPIEPLSSDPAETFSVGDSRWALYSGDLLCWLASERRYAAVETLEAGLAFWLFLPGETGATLLVRGTIVEAPATDLPRGWSFIGGVGPHRYGNLYDDAGEGAAKVEAADVQVWMDGTYERAEDGVLRVGRAQWILMDDPATVYPKLDRETPAWPAR
ncbi:MAG: tandem-95 repeat protein, partial [Lentisphaeria bacterium]|nr:tandem-95 repeat protein [Lentisphaeria bacterium]